MTDCLDERRVLSFLDGTLSGETRSSVEAHLGACSACAELMTWAAADQAHRSGQAGREGRPFVGQLPPGSRVDRYQILGAVGRGGMGEVYAAYHPDLDRRIALKVVSELGADAPERRARLLREARAIARLSHPNVVAVHDAGTVGGRVYIAMEFVEGDTVDEWLRARPRGWREVLDVFIAAGHGLAAAHAAGVIHRDFKPQNVMVGKDGAVRVMDFGLARMAEEPLDGTDAGPDAERSPQPATVTKTGALVGTVAYMAPEQFRGEQLDARADQYSFCVALHEALYGSRPALAHVSGSTPSAGSESAPHTLNVPAWLRAVVTRGLADDRARRFPSMDDLIGALVRGRARPRRRAVAAGAGLVVALLATGGWRAARDGRIHCEVPAARRAAAWSGQDDARRQAIHRAFAATGRATAETSWQHVSQALDDYIAKWSAMYTETCEATHVRGEQSGEVLDLRMSCLNDNLDQVRALTDMLGGADNASVGNAVAAVYSLTPVSRCADVALLRSAVPLPRDQKTLERVQEMRRALREAQALRDMGNFHGARERAVALRSRVEAIGYRPLLAELLELIGGTMDLDDPNDPEAMLHDALVAAEAARDDLTAARAATGLIYFVGVRDGRMTEAERWLRLSDSILDRLGPGQERIRAWARQSFSTVLMYAGDFRRAERVSREAVALKEKALGSDHPDVALSLRTLSALLEELGEATEALEKANRALAILARSGDPDSDLYGSIEETKGEALVSLGRAKEAIVAFTNALRIHRPLYARDSPILAFPLQGLGEAKLVEGEPDAAIPFLEDALRIRTVNEPAKVLIAETQYYLARALWESNRDRRRAVRLALQARGNLADHVFVERERLVVDWIAQHRPRIH